MKSFKTFLSEMANPKETIKCDINGVCRKIRVYESQGNQEKIRTRYLDSKGLPTVAHGHLITPESVEIFKNVFPKQHAQNPSWGQEVLSGKRKMADDEIETLLIRDVTVRLPQIKKMIPDFENLTEPLKAEIASEYFRGMIGKSPKAVKLINDKNFVGAAAEYLDSDEYRDSLLPDSKIAGVATRYQNLENALKTEEARQKKLQQSSKSTTQAPPNNSKPRTGTSR